MARTKGIQVYPDSSVFIKQAHQISHAAYLMPSTQKRILTLLIAQVQIRNNGFELLEVSTGDVLRALEITDSHYAFLREHMVALKQQVLDIDTEDGWVIHSWVDVIRYIKSRDVYQFKLSSELMPYILELRSLWSRIALTDLNKLTGKYSVRLYEMIMAASGFAGQGGNKPGEWFLDLDFADLRIRFKIGTDEYSRTGNFRSRVIDDPIKEINTARIGLNITTDYDRFRRGRTLSGVRLLVKSTLPGQLRNVTPTKEEDEEEALIRLNQDLWDRLWQDEPDDMFGGELAKKGNVWKRFVEHPDLIRPAKGRGRPRKKT